MDFGGFSSPSANTVVIPASLVRCSEVFARGALG